MDAVAGVRAPPPAGYDLTAAHPHSNGVFRDSSTGQPIVGTGSLRDRLRNLVGTRATRLGICTNSPS
ncbi:MAG: hypothetical protein JO296_21695 [Pseudonocardiales bacterium]|nr:hypothetical protein [Pseudonocardiales bacterium]